MLDVGSTLSSFLPYFSPCAGTEKELKEKYLSEDRHANGSAGAEWKLVCRCLLKSEQQQQQHRGVLFV